MTDDPFVVDAEEWATAGLAPEGSFKFRFLSMEPVMRERRDGSGTYPVINGRLQVVAEAQYDGEGNFVGITEVEKGRTRFEDFPLSGSGVKKMKTAYFTLRGESPPGSLNEETGRFQYNTREIAADLVNHEAWNFVYWSDPAKSKDGVTVYDNLTFDFTKSPRGKVKQKKAEK
jgi:hypothetical protein